jgi:3-hydroxyacyl-[acyl-carrier-protein] dehydratase
MELTLPLDQLSIQRILPHRFPFLLVDRITELEPDRRIVGLKAVTSSEPNLSRAGDGRPVLPPATLIEAVAQVGAIMILVKPENRDKLIFFLGIDWARFRRPAYAGDVIVIEAVVKRLRRRMGLFQGTAKVDGRLVAEGAMTYALGPQGAH